MFKASQDVAMLQQQGGAICCHLLARPVKILIIGTGANCAIRNSTLNDHLLIVLTILWMRYVNISLSLPLFYPSRRWDSHGLPQMHSVAEAGMLVMVMTRLWCSLWTCVTSGQPPWTEHNTQSLSSARATQQHSGGGGAHHRVITWGAWAEDGADPRVTGASRTQPTALQPEIITIIGKG